MEPTDIVRLDDLVGVALAYRLAEQRLAASFIDEADPDRRKLDALTLGSLDTLVATHDADSSVLRLLAYVLAVALQGPGAPACAWATRLVGLNRIAELRPYVALGRQLVMRTFIGNGMESGSYARLLLEAPSG